MEFALQDIARIALIGTGATAVLDLWTLGLRRMGVPTLSFAMVGRWIGHWRRGVFAHVAIAKAAPVKGELALGWLLHYATGVAFAAVLAATAGTPWLHSPTVRPAVAVGVATVIAPWFVMQPAMGSGFAASKTPTPGKNRIRTLANHTVFGLGLYLAALPLAWLPR